MSLSFSHVEIPFTGFATPIHRDRRQENTDPCRDYSAVTPMPTHRWTTEQKTVLYLLKDRFKNGWADIKVLFDELFRPEFYSRSGPSKLALRSMHDTLRRIEWTPTGSWKLLCAALEAKAAEIGMELIKEDKSVQQGRTNEWHDSLSDGPLDTGDESDSTLLGDEYESLDNTPSKHSRNAPIGGALEMTRLKSSSNKLRREPAIPRWEIPKLGYRS